ncbi:DUF4097 domain-containing protein [Candidatus Bipolaricaulota bacterium]
MKRKSILWLLALAGALLALSGCMGLPLYEATQTLEGSFDVTGVVDLDVSTSNARVTVRGVEGQTSVEVIATLRSRGGSLVEAANRVAQIVVEMLHDGNHIMLSYDAGAHPWNVRRYSSVDFEITVPPTVDIEVGTSNGRIEISAVTGILDLDTSNGAIDVSDVFGELVASTSNATISVDTYEGTLDLDTSNGRIEMESVTGVIDAQTSNGRIAFSGTLIEGMDHRMATSNGRIDVVLPTDASLIIDARTSNASISTNLLLIGDTEGREWNAVLNPPATGTLTLQTSNGGIEIHGI